MSGSAIDLEFFSPSEGREISPEPCGGFARLGSESSTQFLGNRTMGMRGIEDDPLVIKTRESEECVGLVACAQAIANAPPGLQCKLHLFETMLRGLTVPGGGGDRPVDERQVPSDRVCGGHLLRYLYADVRKFKEDPLQETISLENLM